MIQYPSGNEYLDIKLVSWMYMYFSVVFSIVAYGCCELRQIADMIVSFNRRLRLGLTSHLV